MKRNIINEERKKYFAIERVDMDGSNEDLERESVIRYKFASQWTEGRSVIDSACGDGYGINHLKASEYTGYDIDKKVVAKAIKRYKGNYIQKDLDKVRFPKVDCIVSFETIEHLEDPVSFLKKIAKSCDTFVFSVPNNENLGDNPFHKWIFNENDFKDMIREIFTGFELEFWHQERGEIEKDCYPSYIIGVCKRM